MKMTEVVQLKYNKYSSWFGLILILFIILMSYSSFIKSFNSNETRNWILIGSLDIILLFFILILVIKYLIPGLIGKVAIELNNEGIIENIRNRQIAWNNISGIRLVYSKSKASIAIDIIDESLIIYKSRNIFQKPLAAVATTFWGTPVLISTQYIEGKNSAILEQIQTYYKKNCH